MIERRLIAVEGVVQGVGFRPFVHRLAVARDLRGHVRNVPSGVLIDVEGDGSSLDEFCRALAADAPVLAEIERIVTERAAPKAYRGFRIRASGRDAVRASTPVVPADVATCDACLRELFDAGDRRWGHAFVCCTDCGPRYTIARRAPYDRDRTTMAPFAMCAECRAEYADPANRRFHAVAIACPACGPTLRLASPDAPRGAGLQGPAAIAAAVERIVRGEIVAVKSLGGYQLACDASSEQAVRRLRQRKHRPAKPFAIMVRDARAAARLCTVGDAERALLESGARPIVLLRRGADGSIARSVAPAQPLLGVMLPSTPLHHLLLGAAGRPLVMTSGNLSDEPIAVDDDEALRTLGAVADAFLVHDRRIAARCDDSVVRVVAGGPRVIRRARGYVPASLGLAVRAREVVLALGGHLKNTVCLLSGSRAMLSAHVGDLDAPAARGALRDAIAQLTRAAGVSPSIVAHDLHPDYASTRLAAEAAAERCIAVQHHHAHVAACVAEHRVRGAVIGVALDGTGLGADGAIWGGEFLRVDGARYTRAGHLAYVGLPGGDAASRRPWRAAFAHVARLAGGDAADLLGQPEGVGTAEWALVRQLHARPSGGLPRTSSAGRLFDAVASLLGLCHVSRFEAEAAMALEAAADARAARRYAIPLSDDACFSADPGAMIEAILADRRRGVDLGTIAGAFHLALSDAVVAGCERVRQLSGEHRVALTGGVFANALLLEHVAAGLRERRFEVLIPSLVPCNDGGLALGQAYVAACARAEEDACA